MSENYATVAAQLHLRQEQERLKQEEMREREMRMFESHLNYVVESDATYFWLTLIASAQKHSLDPVTVDNKGVSGWAGKNKSPLYLKALRAHLPESQGYEIRLKWTRWLLRPYIQVSWAPVQSGSA